MPAVDAEMNSFAKRHHGLIDRQTMRALGLSNGQIRRRVQQGRIEALSTDVFRLGGTEDSYDQRLLAATWITSGVASHQSAARLLGLTGYDGSPHVTTSGSQHQSLRGIHIHRTSDPPRTNVSVHGITVTNATRTILDLAAVFGQRELEECLDRALRLRVTTPERLFRLHAEIGGRGRRGSALASRVLADLRSDLTILDSDLESLLLRLIAESGLPLPVTQYQIEVDGNRYRADFCYPSLRLVIEADGFESHGGRSAFEQDRLRQNALVLQGWTVLRFTWRQIVHRPEWVVSQIHLAIEAANFGKRVSPHGTQSPKFG